MDKNVKLIADVVKQKMEELQEINCLPFMQDQMNDGSVILPMYMNGEKYIITIKHV